LEKWCADGPVALLLDDLHWADPASLLVLSRLVVAVGQLPLLLVLAHQPVPEDVALASLLRRLDARGATTLRVGPLDEGSVARLVRRLAGPIPDAELLERAADAAGNPRYVTELVQTAQGPDTGAPIPPSLAGLVTGRLAPLSEPARALVRVA